MTDTPPPRMPFILTEDHLLGMRTEIEYARRHHEVFVRVHVQQLEALIERAEAKITARQVL